MCLWRCLKVCVFLQLLGLDVCADILIGDEMRRGISGGQRKRVTTGEMIVGPTTALFMDEISTGLDSSTTFSIVSSLRQFVKVLEGTILMSLLQPAPETFDLFDDIILLSEGQIVYHGPSRMPWTSLSPVISSALNGRVLLISYKRQVDFFVDLCIKKYYMGCG